MITAKNEVVSIKFRIFSRNHTTMKKIGTFLLLALLAFPVLTNAQDGETKDKPWRLEIEPVSYFSPGWSFLASYAVTKDRNLQVGLYTIGINMPGFLKTAMFDNIDADDPLRLTFQLATSFRYKIPVFKNTESNPYVGAFFGWQTYNHKDISNNNLETNFSNMFVTPHIGYEIYVYKEIVYLNPAFRVVYEFNRDSDYNNPLDANDPGPRIKDWLWLPSFSVGLRL
jgi:hypothetical protein